MDPIITNGIVLAVITVLSPLLTSLFTKTNMASKTKTTVAIIISFIIAGGYLLFTGGITDWTQIIVVLPAVFGAQQAVYKLLAQKLATNIEANYGLTTKKPTELKEAVETTAVDGSEVVAAVNVPLENETPAKG